MDVTCCWDETLLHNCRNEIVALSRSCSRCHEHCCRFLSAAGSLAGDTYRLALDCVDTEKLAGYCTRLSDREFRAVGKTPGKEKVRFLSAVTNKGVVKFTDSAKQLCERIFLISDDCGAVSRQLLHSLRAKALAAGYDVISCYCPLGPFDKLEQLFVPSLGLGFMTSNRFHDFSLEVDPYRIINSQRFTENDKLKGGKKRINFNRKVMTQMLGQAQLLLEEAKTKHDELEGYYVSAMDFEAVDQVARSVIGKISALA